MGKDSELLHAVKLCDVSAIRKFLLKYKSGAKGSKFVNLLLETYLMNCGHPTQPKEFHHSLKRFMTLFDLIEPEFVSANPGTLLFRFNEK